MTRKPIHYAWIVAGVTFIVLLMTAGVRATPGVLMVPLENEFGWSRAAMREQLRIELAPLENDPLDLPPDQRAWEPWPPALSKVSFLRQLQALAADQKLPRADNRPTEEH